MKKFIIISILIGGINIIAGDNVRFIHDNGFGARAFSLSNNFVAVSTDLSAIYWNPAALSFSLVREVQASFDASTFEGKFSFIGNDEFSKMNRMKISNAGLLYSFPATQGGMTIAFSYSNPIVFDDIFQFSIDGLYKSFRTSGGLKYLSGGFGLQIAPRIGVGASVSFVYGREDVESTTQIDFSQNDSYIDTTIEYGLDGKYAGYDIRLGAIYKDNWFSAGLRFTFPQIIRISESDNETVYTRYNSFFDEANGKYSGKMYSSYNGAAGLSLTLPFMTISTEGRATFPFGFVFPSEKIPENSQANFFKVGGGVGIEFPIPKLPVLIRTGYSYDEVDLHRFISKYKGENEFVWSDDYFAVDRNNQQVSAGIGFFNSSFSLDISYRYSMWKISQLTPGLSEKFIQDYSLHKVMVSFAIRY